MAKENKKKNEPKKLNDLKLADLKARQAKTGDKIENLKEQKKAADTPAEKKAIQSQIDTVKGNRTNIKNVISDKQAIKQATYEELAAKIYASDAYQNLSDANKQLVQSQVDLLTVEQLKNLNPSKKEVANMYQQAKNSVIQKDKNNPGSFKDVKKQLDQTYEEQLRGEVSALEAGVATQAEALANDNTLTQDQKNMAMRQLQDALSEAKSQYEVAANRQNEWLQTQLSDAQKLLDTSLGRADEDKVLELRKLERLYNSQLNDVQTSMEQRGLAFSGIRARSEDDLAGQYEDNMTTAQLDAQRKSDDARTLNSQTVRDANTITSQALQDLITKFTGIERTAIQGAESVLGTVATQGLVTPAASIAGGNPNDLMFGNITGSANATSATKLTGQTNLNNYYSNFEQTYGTKALQDKFGAGVIGARPGYAGYTPMGNFVGSQTNAYQQGKRQNKANKNVNIESLVQQKKDQALIGKLI